MAAFAVLKIDGFYHETTLEGTIGKPCYAWAFHDNYGMLQTWNGTEGKDSWLACMVSNISDKVKRGEYGSVVRSHTPVPNIGETEPGIRAVMIQCPFVVTGPDTIEEEELRVSVQPWERSICNNELAEMLDVVINDLLRKPLSKSVFRVDGFLKDSKKGEVIRKPWPYDSASSPTEKKTPSVGQLRDTVKQMTEEYYEEYGNPWERMLKEMREKAFKKEVV